MAVTSIQQSTNCAKELVAITASDTVDLPIPCPAIHVSVGGAVKIITLNGSTVTIPFVAGGGIWQCGAQRVFATGTTATGLFAVYN